MPTAPSLQPTGHMSRGHVISTRRVPSARRDPQSLELRPGVCGQSRLGLPKDEANHSRPGSGKAAKTVCRLLGCPHNTGGKGSPDAEGGAAHTGGDVAVVAELSLGMVTTETPPVPHILE